MMCDAILGSLGILAIALLVSIVPFLLVVIWDLKLDRDMYQKDMVRYRTMYDEKVFLLKHLREVLDGKRKGGEA
jgi:hypothetical protein